MARRIVTAAVTVTDAVIVIVIVTAFVSVRIAVIGTDTVAGSLRNANQSIRSDPPNPMQYVGPWMLSTIYPDLLRRPLEGCGPSFGVYGNGPLGGQVPVETKELI